MNSLTIAINRAKQSNPTVGVAVRKGLFRVVSVTYSKKGVSTVRPLSDWLCGPQIIPFLNSI